MFTDAYAAAQGSHALCVLTEWDEFKVLDYQKIYTDMVRACRQHCGWMLCCHVVLSHRSSVSTEPSESFNEVWHGGSHPEFLTSMLKVPDVLVCLQTGEAGLRV